MAIILGPSNDFSTILDENYSRENVKGQDIKSSSRSERPFQSSQQLLRSQAVTSSASPLDSSSLIEALNDDETSLKWIMTWGQQLLRLPQLLLCLLDARITIFALESNLPKPERVSRTYPPLSNVHPCVPKNPMCRKDCMA
jgi:hypothetical protein